MDRADIDRLLELAQDIESGVQVIKNELYLTSEDYDDMILSAQMSLEKVAEVFANTVKYLDEQVLLKELEITENDELD